MPNKSLLIRADASSIIGMGHRVRCQILADILSSESWTVTFVCHSSCHAFSQDNDILIDSEDEFLALAKNTDMVVLDHYGYTSQMIEKLYRVQPNLFLLDDMNDRGALYCRYLLNPVALDYSANLENQKRRYNEIPTLLTGISYALLRPQFFRKSRSTKANKLLITMGGTDPLRLTLPLLKQLLQCGFDSKNIIVMLGGSAQQADEVTLFCRLHEVVLHRNVEDVAELMSQARMAISAGGSTLFELATMRIPSIFLQVADNQTQLLKAHVDKGWCRVYHLHNKSNEEAKRLVESVCDQALLDWKSSNYLEHARSHMPTPHSIKSTLTRLFG